MDYGGGGLKMPKSEKVILIGLLILVFLGLGFALYGFVNKEKIPTGTTNFVYTNTNSKYETKSSSSTVSIDLTPVKYENSKFYVDIAVNTHNTDLSQFDLKKIVTLIYDGKNINPISVFSLTGHHTSGTLIFSLDEEPKNFEIIIKDLPDINERSFKW